MNHDRTHPVVYVTKCRNCEKEIRETFRAVEGKQEPKRIRCKCGTTNYVETTQPINQ